MDNPYRQAPDHAFWSRAVSGRPAEAVQPVVDPTFGIAPDDRIATAGSCFAQHISQTLQAEGYHYLVAEPGDPSRQYGVYPARFGNIYTPRQLLQLIQRAFGLFWPSEPAWRLGEAFVDPFRPQVEPGGFPTREALEADRAIYLQAVRDLFQTANVLIFTLGLTEAWVSDADGAVFPSAPGVAGAPDEAGHIRPHNFTVTEAVDDLTGFIGLARTLNPALRILLTVSPVPLVATFTGRHVLTATTWSKSVLRVAAQTVADSLPLVDYFPSYEIVTGAHNAGRFWAEDLRSVRPEGVAAVMAEFKRAYLGKQPSLRLGPDVAPPPDRRAEHEALGEVICDEEANDG